MWASKVAKYLAKDGALLQVSDINADNLRRANHELGAEIIDNDKVFEEKTDIYVSCALGGVINDQSLVQLDTNVIAGAANNQLLLDHHGQALFDKGIVYAPDYVIIRVVLLPLFVARNWGIASRKSSRKSSVSTA